MNYTWEHLIPLAIRFIILITGYYTIEQHSNKQVSHQHVKKIKHVRVYSTTNWNFWGLLADFARSNQNVLSLFFGPGKFRSAAPLVGIFPPLAIWIWSGLDAELLALTAGFWVGGGRLNSVAIFLEVSAPLSEFLDWEGRGAGRVVDNFWFLRIFLCEAPPWGGRFLLSLEHFFLLEVVAADMCLL